jgi:hypothetical protein
VADQPDSLDAQRVEQGPQVIDQPVQPVIRWPYWRLAVAESAQVGRDHPVAGLHQRGNLVAPDPMAVGKTMHQHHVRPFAFDDDVERDAVDLDLAAREWQMVFRGAHARASTRTFSPLRSIPANMRCNAARHSHPSNGSFERKRIDQSTVVPCALGVS